MARQDANQKEHTEQAEAIQEKTPEELEREERKRRNREKSNRNLIDIRTRSPEEQLEIRRKSAAATNAKKARQKSFQEAAKAVLRMKPSKRTVKSSLGEDAEGFLKEHGEQYTMQDLILARQALEAYSGSVRAAEYIRDSAGYKPKEQLEVETMSEADQLLVGMVAARLGLKELPEDDSGEA